MFIILINFKQPQEILNQYLSEHRDFLDDCYEKGYFIASGQNKQQTGGIIISQLNGKLQLEEIIKKDPLYIHDIAQYDIREFTPTKYHPSFSAFIDKK